MKNLAVHFEKRRIGTIIHAERQKDAVVVTVKFNKVGQKLMSSNLMKSVSFIQK